MCTWTAEHLEVVTAVAAAQEANFHGIDGIEDSVSVLGRFVGGASFTLSSVWHEIDDRPSQRRIELFCEHRLITLEGDIFGPVSVQSDDESFTIEGDELVRWLRRRGVPLGSAEQQFLRAVRMHEHPRPDADDALRAHEVVDALYASARGGGERVRLRG